MFDIRKIPAKRLEQCPLCGGLVKKVYGKQGNAYFRCSSGNCRYWHRESEEVSMADKVSLDWFNVGGN